MNLRAKFVCCAMNTDVFSSQWYRQANFVHRKAYALNSTNYFLKLFNVINLGVSEP